MKKWKKVITVLTATLALTLGTACVASAANGEIHVNGRGVVQANPDTAEISLNISTDGKTAQTAQAENNKIVAAVTNAMTKLNVKKEDIVTAYTSVFPNYRYNDSTGKRTLIGYQAETNLQVKTRDIDNAGKYIDAALLAGATGTNGVSFSIADSSNYYEQALQAAVKNAQASADAIAQAYGKPLGAVKSVTVTSENALYEESRSTEKQNLMADSAAGGGGTSISYGKIEITAAITVGYAF